MRFDGVCPFLTCLADGPHEHDTCSDCGAVRYGNAFCATCRSHWPERQAEMAQILLEITEGKNR